jgi:hypothetical protein
MTPAPLLAFPSATGFVINHLAAAVSPVPVSSRVPAAKGPFVRVLRTGGPASTPILDPAQITLDCYAAYEDQAEQLAQDVRAHLHALEGSNGIKRVLEYSGPANFPDPRTPDMHRFTFTIALELRGTQEGTP